MPCKWPARAIQVACTPCALATTRPRYPLLSGADQHPRPLPCRGRTAWCGPACSGATFGKILWRGRTSTSQEVGHSVPAAVGLQGRQHRALEGGFAPQGSRGALARLHEGAAYWAPPPLSFPRVPPCADAALRGQNRVWLHSLNFADREHMWWRGSTLFAGAPPPAVRHPQRRQAPSHAACMPGMRRGCCCNIGAHLRLPNMQPSVCTACLLRERSLSTSWAPARERGRTVGASR